MRSPASEKLEIIRLVEQSHLPVKRTLAKLGIPRTTFYRWYDRYLQRGEAGLQDQSPKPKHVWNRVPDEVQRKVVDFALQELQQEGFAIQGRFDMRRSFEHGEVEWCERGLLSRIHRYTLKQLRSEIEPASPADFMRYLFLETEKN